MNRAKGIDRGKSGSATTITETRGRHHGFQPNNEHDATHSAGPLLSGFQYGNCAAQASDRGVQRRGEVLAGAGGFCAGPAGLEFGRASRAALEKAPLRNRQRPIWPGTGCPWPAWVSSA